MKKLMFGLAALAAGSVMAIESANVVGYHELTIKPGLNLVGTSFLKCDGTGRPDINASFADCKGKATTGVGSDVADFIQVFDATKKGYPYGFYFYADAEYPDPEYDYLWCNTSDDETSTFVIPTGNAFWYTSRSAEDFKLTSSGMVGAESVELTIKPGLNLIVNPFPCELPLNSSSVNWKSAGATTGVGSDVADFIQVFDATKKGYPYGFYFYADAEYPDPEYDYLWCNTSDDETSTFVVPAGAGFWYTHRGNSDITLTFKSPLAK